MLIEYIQKTISHLSLCITIKTERETLAKLSNSELQDIGIHRADVDAERRRSFFDIPEDRIKMHNEQGEPEEH